MGVQLHHVAHAGVVFIMDGAAHREHRVRRIQHKLKRILPADSIHDGRKNVLHALLRRSQLHIFRQNAVNHIRAVRAGFIGQAVHSVHHIVHQHNTVYAFAQGPAPPCFECKFIVYQI